MTILDGRAPQRGFPLASSPQNYEGSAPVWLAPVLGNSDDEVPNSSSSSSSFLSSSESSAGILKS